MRVLIVHFRSAPGYAVNEPCQLSYESGMDSAGTDGVSLQMMVRSDVLKEMGHQVAVCSGCNWADFPIPALEYDSEEVKQMIGCLYGTQPEDPISESELKRMFDVSRSHLKQEFEKVITDFAPGVLFAHNILSLPVNPVATVALTEVLGETRLPCAAIHHDVLSEGAYTFKPTCNFAKSILSEYFPPVMPNLRHWVINTRNQKVLGKRGIDVTVVPDFVDFDAQPDLSEWARMRAYLRNKYGIKLSDIVLFAGARLVPNKQTEIAGHLTAALQNLRQEIVSRKLYSGEIFSEESRIVLVVAGRTERAFADYQTRVFELFDALPIDWIYVGNEVRALGFEEEGLFALYDIYTMADFFLYPSGWEGFGAGLLKAIAARLPVASFEYPVFKEDIAPKGIMVASFGDTILEERDSAGLVQIPAKVLVRAASEIITILTTPELYRRIADNNFMVGKKYFSIDVLRSHLQDVLDWANSLAV